MKVLIIGAGIIGASLAYALSRQGAQVTVIDRAGPAAGATGRSFGWINASFYHDPAHHALRVAGIEAYRALCKDLRLPVVWSGCLCWENSGAELQAQAQDLQDLGYDAQIVDRADFAKREPHVIAPDQALYFQAEAVAEPAEMVGRLLAASGAQVVTGWPVEALLEDGGRVTGVSLGASRLHADRVVVAGGTGSAALLAQVGVALPMLTRPGAIVHTAPLPPLLSHVCVAPIGEFRQTPEGQIVMPTAVAHQADTSERIDTAPDVLAAQTCARLQALIPDVPLQWQQVARAQRPVPQDGLPVVGACGPAGLYTAVMHSGMTLGPVVGALLARQMMDQPLSNAQAALLAPYGPDRFQNG